MLPNRSAYVKSYDGKTKWIKVWISCQKNTIIFEKCL